MHKVELIGPDGKARQRTLPSAWAECSVAQLGVVAALTSVPQDEGLAPAQREHAEAQVRILLFKELCGLSAAEFAALEPSDLLGVRSDEHGVDRVALLPWVDWCFAEPDWAVSLVPEVMVRKVRYEGPRDMLGGWPVARWIFSDHNLRALAADGGEEHLHNLLGCLYAPAGTAWHHERIEAFGAALRKLDDRTKLAAVLNYRGLRAWLAGRYRMAFRGGAKDPHGPEGMIVRLAGPKFGDVEEVWYKPLSSVLVHVEQSILDAEEAKRKTPS